MSDDPGRAEEIFVRQSDGGHDVGGQAFEEATFEDEPFADERLPWLFVLTIAMAALYVAWRIVQLVIMGIEAL